MAHSLRERFERQVDRSGDHHVWLGARSSARGTGRLKVKGKDATAHRVAWELAHGDIPAGARVRPCSIEPLCVRIDHLQLSGAGERSRAPRRASKGSGSKRELRPGVWELSVTAGRDADGQPRRRFRTVRGTKAEASRALTAFVGEVGDGHALPRRSARGITLGALMSGYLDHLRNHKGRKHSTLVRYQGLADTWIHPTLGDRPAERVLPQDIEALLGAMRAKGLSQSSIHQAFTVLNGTFKWARRNRMVTHNPVQEAEEPRSTAVPHEAVPPDIEGLRRLLTEAMSEEPDFGLLCHIGAVTGMRRGELAGLRWDRLDLDRGRVRVEITVNDAGGEVVIDNFTKTRKTRSVSIDRTTISLLRAHRRAVADRARLAGTELSAGAFVVSHALDGSTPVRPEYLTRQMRQLRKRLGLHAAEFDATLQALRHWTQTTLTEAGYDTRQVAARGGHSEQVMRSVYVHRTTKSEEQMSAYLGHMLAPADRRGLHGDHLL